MVQLPDVGKILKEARENKNITLKEAEKITKIRSYYLQALEEEKYEKLPGKVYAIGFLKTYASFLGLEYELLVKSLKDKIVVPEENITTTTEKEVIVKNSKLNIKRYLLAFAALIILCSVYFIYNTPEDSSNEHLKSNISQKQDANQQETAVDKSKEVFTELPSEDISIPQYDGVNLRIVVIDSKCWIRVISDGDLIYEGTLLKDQEKEFKANKEIKIRFGNPQAVKAIFNGKVFTYEGLNKPHNETFKVE